MIRRELLSHIFNAALMAPAAIVGLAGKPSRDQLPPLPEPGVDDAENIRRLVAWSSTGDAILVLATSLEADLQSLDIDQDRRRRIIAQLERVMNGVREAGPEHRAVQSRALQRLGY